MKRGEIWLVEFPTSGGHEQEGTRPVMIVADTPPVAVIIPFTSNVQALRFPHTVEIRPTKANGLIVPSIALLFQIRAIDIRRLKKKIGEIERPVAKQIDKMIRTLLGLE